MTHAKVKDLPDVLQFALRDIGYHRADVSLEAADTMSPQGAGGSGLRDFVMIVDMSSGETRTMQGSWGGSNPFNPGNQVDMDSKSYLMPKNTAVIKGSTGSHVFANIYLHPDNFVKFLPTIDPSLSDRDRWILYTFVGLTSAGRKDEWDRSGDIPSENDLNRLASSGYLKRNKTGATQITTEGKNILNRKPGQTIHHPNTI